MKGKWNMKRLILIVLALVMVLSLCACGGAGETGGETKPTTGSKQELSDSPIGYSLKIDDVTFGIGMDAEAINRSLAATDLHRDTTGASIGLHNINARLKILYGEQYGLRIESRENQGTKVIMTLPGDRTGVVHE